MIRRLAGDLEQRCDRAVSAFPVPWAVYGVDESLRPCDVAVPDTLGMTREQIAAVLPGFVDVDEHAALVVHREKVFVGPLWELLCDLEEYLIQGPAGPRNYLIQWRGGAVLEADWIAQCTDLGLYLRFWSRAG